MSKIAKSKQQKKSHPTQTAKSTAPTFHEGKEPQSSPAKPPLSTKPSSKIAPQDRAASKHNQILSLLRRKPGASIEELQKVSGWQSHSVRGFLSGTVKKRLGLKLQSAQAKDGERRYMVVG